MTSLKLVTANIKFYKWYSLFFILPFESSQGKKLEKVWRWKTFRSLLFFPLARSVPWWKLETKQNTRNGRTKRRRRKHSFDGKTFYWKHSGDWAWYKVKTKKQKILETWLTRVLRCFPRLCSTDIETKLYNDKEGNTEKSEQKKICNLFKMKSLRENWKKILSFKLLPERYTIFIQ